jgi:galactonate dehydratase
VYADGFFRGAEYVQEEYAEKAVAAIEEGLTALKMDVDEPIPSGRALNRSLTTGDLHLTSRMVGAVRNAVGREIDLCIDAHGAFDVTSATKLGRTLEEYDLMWIEDPVPMGNMSTLSKVSQEIQTPICTGELMETRFEFRELFERQAADIIMPDLARTGGILEMKKIAAMADTYYIPVSPHNMAGPLATIASAHLCACIPNFMVLEYQLTDVPWRDDLLTSPLPIKDGYLELFEAPGLGVELNKKALEKHRAE